MAITTSFPATGRLQVLRDPVDAAQKGVKYEKLPASLI
jgi:hypothetical protein